VHPINEVADSPTPALVYDSDSVRDRSDAHLADECQHVLGIDASVQDVLQRHTGPPIQARRRRLKAGA
jgi:hypothetical protein